MKLWIINTAWVLLALILLVVVVGGHSAKARA